jgi:hypothetical protein
MRTQVELMSHAAALADHLLAPVLAAGFGGGGGQLQAVDVAGHEATAERDREQQHALVTHRFVQVRRSPLILCNAKTRG